MMTTVPILESTESAGWASAVPSVTVVVSTYNRAELLSGLLDSLESQSYVDFEVVIADNGSSDTTWESLRTRAAHSELKLKAIRLPAQDGPATPRNTAISVSRAPLVAFTDDDCLPEPGWLAELTAPFEAPGVVIAQGRTTPPPGATAGAWDRTLLVKSRTGLYETANLAIRVTAIHESGGFPAKRLLSGRAFGEDVLLGSAVARRGGFEFVDAAVVRHRLMPGDYRSYLSERWRLEGFPYLIREVPDLRRQAWAGLFLGRRQAVTDMGLLGLGLATVTGQAFYLVAALPWARRAWREAAGRPGRPQAVRMAQVMVGDGVGTLALVRGSIGARRLLL